jgi:hypothetical protein
MLLKNIGGIYDTPKTYDMEGDQFEIVPKAIQKKKQYIFKHSTFQHPKWLMDQKIYSKINPDNGVEAIKEMQNQH